MFDHLISDNRTRQDASAEHASYRLSRRNWGLVRKCALYLSPAGGILPLVVLQLFFRQVEIHAIAIARVHRAKGDIQVIREDQAFLYDKTVPLRGKLTHRANFLALCIKDRQANRKKMM